jgi:ribose 5-phosphate isomerase B
MKVILANDHRGTQLKMRFKEFLDQMHIESFDVGAFSADSVDYPDFGASAAKKVSEGEYDRAVLICGSGIGMCIVANKFPRVRAALCHDVQAARMTREHNDSNVLCLGADVVSEGLAQDILKTWLETEFEGGRHLRRVEKIRDIESQLARGDG